jgi:hypothetical protein
MPIRTVSADAPIRTLWCFVDSVQVLFDGCGNVVATGGSRDRPAEMDLTRVNISCGGGHELFH